MPCFLSGVSQRETELFTSFVDLHVPLSAKETKLEHHKCRNCCYRDIHIYLKKEKEVFE